MMVDTTVIIFGLITNNSDHYSELVVVQVRRRLCREKLKEIHIMRFPKASYNHHKTIL